MDTAMPMGGLDSRGPASDRLFYETQNFNFGEIPPEVKTEPMEMEFSYDIKTECPDDDQSGSYEVTSSSSTLTCPTVQPMVIDSDHSFSPNQLVKIELQQEDNGFDHKSKSIDQINGEDGILSGSSSSTSTCATTLVENEQLTVLTTSQPVICFYCGMKTIFGSGYLKHVLYCSRAKVMCVCHGCGQLYPKPKCSRPKCARFPVPEADRLFCYNCPSKFCFQVKGDEFVPGSRISRVEFICWYCGCAEKISKKPTLLPGVAPACRICAKKLRLCKNKKMHTSQIQPKVKTPVKAKNSFSTNQKQALFHLSQIRSLMGCEKPYSNATGDGSLIRLCTSLETAIKKSNQPPPMSDTKRQSTNRMTESAGLWTGENRNTLFSGGEHFEIPLVIGNYDGSIAQRDDDYELYLERKRVCDLLERSALESGQIKPCSIAVHRLPEKGHRPSALANEGDLVWREQNKFPLFTKRRSYKKRDCGNVRVTLKRRNSLMAVMYNRKYIVNTLTPFEKEDLPRNLTVASLVDRILIEVEWIEAKRQRQTPAFSKDAVDHVTKRGRGRPRKTNTSLKRGRGRPRKTNTSLHQPQLPTAAKLHRSPGKTNMALTKYPKYTPVTLQPFEEDDYQRNLTVSLLVDWIVREVAKIQRSIAKRESQSQNSKVTQGSLMTENPTVTKKYTTQKRLEELRLLKAKKLKDFVKVMSDKNFSRSILSQDNSDLIQNAAFDTPTDDRSILLSGTTNCPITGQKVKILFVTKESMNSVTKELQPVETCMEVMSDGDRLSIKPAEIGVCAEAGVTGQISKKYL